MHRAGRSHCLSVEAVYLKHYTISGQTKNRPGQHNTAGSGGVERRPGYCVVQHHMVRLLQKGAQLFDNHNIAYKELDIEQSASARREYDRLNGKGVPLTSINGKLVRGYQPERILNLAKSKT